MALTDQARQQYKDYFDNASSDEEKNDLFEGIKIAHKQPNQHIHTRDELLSLGTEARKVKTASEVVPTDSDFVPGIKRGLQNLQATAYGAEALAGSGLKKIGLESIGTKLQEHGIEGYQRNIEEAEMYPKKYSFKDVYTGEAGIGGTIDWAQGTLGELVPSMVEAALGVVAGTLAGTATAPGPGTVAGGVGGLAARTVLRKSIDKLVKEGMKRGIKGITEKELRKQVTKQALRKLGSRVGLGAAILPLESGGMYGELFTEHGIDAPETALLFGSLATSLEYFGGNSKLVTTFIDSLVKGSKGIAKKTAKELLTQIPEEALQEGGQELLSILNTVVNTDEELLTVENVERIVESMAAGAVGGGAGAGANVLLSNRPEGASTPDDQISQQAENIISNGPEVVQASINQIDQDLDVHNNLLGNEESLAVMAEELGTSVDDVIKEVRQRIDDYSKLKDRLASSFTDEQQVGTETTPSVDEQVANEDINLNPSESQKEAGNYKKADVKIDGLSVKIENPDGSTRSGTDADGNEWQTQMNGHYGYFARTEGKDGDQVDVFIKPGTVSSPQVYIVDQVNPASGKFDEHKVIMGATSEEEARQIYLSNYNEGWQGLDYITEMNQEDFKEWLGDKKRTKKALKPKEESILVSPIPEDDFTFIADDGRAFTRVKDVWYDNQGNIVKNIKIKPAETTEAVTEDQDTDLGRKAIDQQSEAIQQLYAELGVTNRDELLTSRRVSPERKAELLWLEVAGQSEAAQRARQAYIKNTLGIDIGPEFEAEKSYLRPKPEIQRVSPEYSLEQLNSLKGIVIKMPVPIADTGEVSEIDIDAYEAYMENAEQRNVLGKLLDCLAG